MPDYNTPTGTHGTLIIRDDGSTVSFIIQSTNSATSISGGSWSGTVNGTGVGGTFSLSGVGFTVLGSWTVSTNQTVVLNMGATGTSGLGGPTSGSANIVRFTATVPSAPRDTSITDVGVSSMRVNFNSPASDGGAAIIDYLVRVSKNPDLSAYTDYATFGSMLVTGLDPGTQYYCVVYARNSVGYSPASNILTARTIAPVMRRVDGVWRACAVYVKVGGVWRIADPYLKVSGVWRRTRG